MDETTEKKDYRVLVVEDMAVQAKKLIFYLKKFGYHVDWAQDGLEALEIVRREDYTLLISDIQMPRMDGLEMLAELRKDQKTRGVSVIMLTTLDNEETFSEAIALDVDDFIAKPFNPKELVLRVKNIIKKREAEDLVKIQLSAMDNAIDGMAIMDKEGRYVYANDAHVNVFGFFSSKELSGTQWDTLYPADEIIRLREDIMPIVQQEGQWSGELRAIRKDGTEYPQELSITTNADSGLVCICRDITERKEIEKLIETQRLQLHSSAKMSALGEMAAGIAHEINNPLSIVSMGNTMLKNILSSDNVDLEKVNKIVDKNKETIERMSVIIKSMRNIYRDTTNEKFTEILVKDLVSDSTELCRDKFSSHGVELIVDASEEILNSMIEAKRVSLSQVLINLFNNAFDAVKESKDEKMWVKINLEMTDENFIINLIDSGKGIPEEIQDKIFEPFYTTKDVGEGTGLGLSLSASIIKDHSGTMKIDNESENTKFVITLPLKQSE